MCKYTQTPPKCSIDLIIQSTTRDYIRAEGDFHKEIYIVKRTNKTEIRPEVQSEKTERCRENLWNEMQLKGL